MTRPSDESTDSCRYSRVIPLTVRSVMASTFASAVTWIDDHVADLVTHESSVKTLTQNPNYCAIRGGLGQKHLKNGKIGTSTGHFSSVSMLYTFAMATESKINEDVVAVPVPQGTLDAVSNGTFYNPHEVLGGHLGIRQACGCRHDPSACVRLARSVTIITEQGQTLDDP